MPAELVNTFAKKTGKSIDVVEKLWNKAKTLTLKEYPKVKEDSESFYKITVGILKRMLKIESEASNTLSTIGGTTDGVPDPDSYKYFKKLSFGQRFKKKKKKKKILI